MIQDKNDSSYITLFKLFGLYQIVKKESPKIFNYSTYVLIIIFLTLCATIILLTELTGIFLEVLTPTAKLDNGFKDLQQLFVFVCMTIGNVKMISIILNRNKIFNLFDTTTESFLLNGYSKTYAKRFKSGKNFKKTFPTTCFLIFVSLALWLMTPIILNNMNAVHNKAQIDMNTRKLSPTNFKYPIQTTTYNNWYKAFYLVESILLTYSIYCMVLYDLFLFSILQLISNHYKSITTAIKVFDFRGERKDGELIIFIIIRNI